MKQKIYLPTLDFKFCEWYNSSTIRCFDKNVYDNYANYRDYYINSHYLYSEGQRRYNLETIELIPQEDLTTDFYYRNDFPDILFMFVCFSFICFYLPLKFIYSKWFKRKC